MMKDVSRSASQFERAILALGETIAWERRSGDDGNAALGKGAADFLLSVHRRMPDFLRPPFHILVLVFDVWPLLRKGRLFHQLPLDDRLAELDSWRRSRLEIRRRFVEFYASLGVFSVYSDLYGRDYQYGDLPPGERARS
ncbi:hypothetical protein EN859_014045 [Mesorhizobium sp. M00.F.Ca.ET.216.01.1.1]|nr:hypothetical protein EN859_014045 [Mesorhizobium sp. M00.F.Ca.ET.216.01.1.1]